MWHLLWMSLVVVVVVPTNLDIGRFTNISFLGAYLSETSLAPGSFKKEKPHATSYDLGSTLAVKEVSVDLPQRKPPSGYMKDNAFLGSVNPLQDKKTDVQIAISSSELSYAKLTNKQLEGEVRNRGILYRPDESFLRNVISQAEGGAAACLSFGVSDNGEVKFINILTSTGNPELDTLFTRYLKSWRFEPAVGAEGRIQAGEARLSF